MDTWLVFITARTLHGRPVTSEAVRALQEDLILNAGRSDKPGVTPEVTTTPAGAARIRQCFPMVDAYQAVQLASESFRRHMKREEVASIEAVRHSDWLHAQP
ncbi:hypothetical protein [Streptomyces prunicolor]